MNQYNELLKISKPFLTPRSTEPHNDIIKVYILYYWLYQPGNAVLVAFFPEWDIRSVKLPLMRSLRTAIFYDRPILNQDEDVVIREVESDFNVAGLNFS